MTLDQFITKYSGKMIDFDGAYAGQCVDLYRQYCKEVLAFPQSPPVRGAADIWDTYLKNCFTRYENTPTAVPQKGDVMLWNKNAGGGFGHVAVFISGDANKFKSFDQNWRALSVCEITDHNYTNVLGWIRPSTSTTTENEPSTGSTSGENMYTEQQMTAVRLERDKNWDLYQSTLSQLQTNKEEYFKTLEILRKQISALESEKEALQLDLAKPTVSQDVHKTIVDEFQLQVDALVLENETLKKQMSSSQTRSDNNINDSASIKTVLSIPIRNWELRLLKIKEEANG